MIYRRPWKSASLRPSSPAPSDGDVSGGKGDAKPSESNKRSLAFFVFLPILVAIVIVGSASLLVKLIMSPQPKGYGDNRAAICAIQKGALRYLDEWVQYHVLAVGFEDIYLYDNSENFELQAWHESYIPRLRQRIHIQHFPGVRKQNKAYTHCMKQVQNKGWHDWIAFIDIDEFVVLRNPKQYPKISDFLETLPPEYGGLAVNWVVFLLNHQMHYQDLPVTLRFQNRTDDATNRHIKTIARTKFVRKALNPHYVAYRLFQWWLHTYDSRGNIVKGPFNPELADEEIAVYHYHSKSMEEYKERCSRGRATVSKKIAEQHLACQSEEKILENLQEKPELTKDDAPWQLLKERVPSYTNKYSTL
ncbi:unnamed protein product [Cylindrotheca closterium]|uniref:Glycosyltransferase family 92 protein n=1 Tax=Cylindrotheca closterium TaxID=2856 RepID=A0AAD2JJF6_9STRA|nr:unnamed protein product [Cylindrotheca closterium]